MKNTVNKRRGLSRLFEIAGEKKKLLFISAILSAISAIFMFVPFVSVYKVLGELLRNADSISDVNKKLMVQWGWIAFAGLLGGLMVMYCSLMFSHVAAFRILYGLRMKLARHIGKLSLGYLNGTSIGAVKKTLEQNVERIELFVAHTIPDIVNVAATVVVMFAIFFSLNGWMAPLTCLFAFALSIATQFSMMFGEKAQQNYSAKQRQRG